MLRYASYAITVVAVFGSTLAAQPVEPAPTQLRNWAAPLYWQPSPEEVERHADTHGGRSAKVVTGNAAVTPPTPAVFVAITPCRFVDTRPDQGFPSPWGAPALAAYTQRNFDLQTSLKCPGIPSTAVAYSFNVTAVPMGALAFLTVWPFGTPYPGVSTLNSPSGAVIANAAIVPAGLYGSITVVAGNATHLIIDINGYYTSAGLTGFTTVWNTAIGYDALKDNPDGTSGNTAVGSRAMWANTGGSNNTAIGMDALFDNGTGEGNVATGTYAMRTNSSGNNNTALGYSTLTSLASGSDNTAVGHNALWSVSGNSSGNVAVGKDALVNAPMGTGNTAIGSRAGDALRYGDANIYIGQGAGPGNMQDFLMADESSTTRIGSAQTRAFFAGIRSVTTGTANAVPVVIDSNGQLGTVSSSRRVKRDIDDMGDTTDALMALHPVRFHYTAHGPDSPLQYGLIAEEVAEIAPDLVARNKAGEIETVYYDKVNAMLLNEVQKLHREREAQSAVIKALESRLADLEARLK